ncbi:DUF3696 domain-containing protein [Acetobacterium wieringae]|uniref:DUF3696 domain-containing protein n=1 Tax=Acetobacterium wieringae TaxID=52694 RepID=UPI00203419FF|nr:DUF3696 domain-containing protein [Acetobacterium wieringae]URN84830.1 DUF3696 domain-containing protein [Acetobacterium wieringae]
MLQMLTLNRFRAFSNLDNMQIKPLTILCGVNSGGKTSILKSLLSLKQSYENSSSKNEMTLNGPYVINGLMKDTLYNGKGDSFSIKNSFRVEFHGKRYVTNSKQDITTAKELGKITNHTPSQVRAFDINVVCSIKKGVVSDLWDTNFIDKYEVKVTPISQDTRELTAGVFKINMKYQTGGRGKYNIQLVNFPTISGKKENRTLKGCTCYFNGMRLTNLFYPESGVQLSDFLTNIYSVFRIVSDQYSGIKYLGPLRENPQRQYLISNNYQSSNSTGADTPFLLAKEQLKKVVEELYPPVQEDNFDLKTSPVNKNLLEGVKLWMKYFELGSLDIDNKQDALQLNIRAHNIADVGFGVSQTLPIIVHGLSLDFEQTLLLEQPEIHLHPRMQMRMADFLLSLAQTNHGVIVETHSDHIINRIVRRALEAEDDKLLENIAIYFVKNSTEGSSAEEIKIDRVGGITQCPEEFFNQFASETSHIFKAGIGNMRKAEL